MKKFISVLGAIVLAISLTGCVKMKMTRTIYPNGASHILFEQDITQVNSMSQQQADENGGIAPPQEDHCGSENFPEELKEVECSVSEDGNIITVSGEDETRRGTVEEKNGYLRYTYNTSHFSESIVKEGEDGDAFKEGQTEQEFNNSITGMKSMGITWKIIEIYPGEVLYSGYGNIEESTVTVENIYATFDTFEKASAEYVIIVKTSSAQGSNPFLIPTERLEEPELDENAGMTGNPMERMMMQGMMHGMAGGSSENPIELMMQGMQKSMKGVSRNASVQKSASSSNAEKKDLLEKKIVPTRKAFGLSVSTNKWISEIGKMSQEEQAIEFKKMEELNQESTCHDSDGGSFPKKAGIVYLLGGNHPEELTNEEKDIIKNIKLEKKNITGKDKCTDENTLREHYCGKLASSFMRYKSIKCENGCYQGACIENKMVEMMQEVMKAMPEARKLMKEKEAESERVLSRMPTEEQKIARAKLEEIRKKEGKMVYVSAGPSSTVLPKYFTDKILSVEGKIKSLGKERKVESGDQKLIEVQKKLQENEEFLKIKKEAQKRLEEKEELLRIEKEIQKKEIQKKGLELQQKELELQLEKERIAKKAEKAGLQGVSEKGFMKGVTNWFKGLFD